MESVGLYIYCFAFSVIWLIYQDITQKKLKGVYFLVTLLLSIVFALLFPLNPFLPLFLAFFSLSLLANSKKTLCRHFFYSAFPVIFVDLFVRTVTFFIYPKLFQYDIVQKPFSAWEIVFALLLVLPTNRVLKRLFRIDYPAILQMPDKRIQSYIYSMDGFFILYYLVYYGIFFNVKSSVANYHQLTLLAFIMLLIYMLTLLNRQAQLSYQLEVEKEQSQYLENLEHYSQHLEAIYENIRAFKHDYDNILISLKDCMSNGNLGDIKTVYEDVLKKSRDNMEHDDYLLYQLIPLKDNNLKMMLIRDLLDIKNQGIHVSASICEIPAHSLNLQKDFVLVIHLLLGLAGKLTKASPKPWLKLRITQNESSFEVSVSYATSMERLETSCLCFASQTLNDALDVKEMQTLQAIFQAHPHCQLLFESGSYKAKETLIIEKVREEVV